MSAGELQLALGIAALFALVILISVDWTLRLLRLFRRICVSMGWRERADLTWTGLVDRQFLEARVVIYGLPPGAPVEAQKIAARYRRLAFVYNLLSLAVWYGLIWAGALSALPDALGVVFLAGPPVFAVAVWLTVKPWPR
ncbi:MAG: hypothetical protein AAF908_05465 [Pseudomonadota bacterium]